MTENSLDKESFNVQLEITNLKEAPLKNKLQEMGFLDGKSIKLLYKAPFGDPIAVQVDGSIVSLRLDEAKLISVKRA